MTDEIKDIYLSTLMNGHSWTKGPPIDKGYYVVITKTDYYPSFLTTFEHSHYFDINKPSYDYKLVYFDGYSYSYAYLDAPLNQKWLYDKNNHFFRRIIFHRQAVFGQGCHPKEVRK